MNERRRFLFTTWDGGGNLGPELAIAGRLVRRGHSVRVLGDPTLEQDARRAGCEFSPWTTAPHRTTRERGSDVVRDYETKSPLEMIHVYLRDFLAGPAPRWIADTLRELEARPADALVTDFGVPTALAAAEKLGIPAALLFPNVWMIPTPGIPPFGPGLMPPRGPLGRARDAVLRAVTRHVFDRALPAINGARAAHGLPALASTHEQLLRCERVLVLSSPVFDFTSPAMPAHVRYTGPELDDPPWTSPWRSPWPDDDRRPLVLASLSSTFQDQVATLRRLVEALGSLPVRALVTLGPAVRPDEIGPTNGVAVVPSAPHAEVLKEASLLVTHCGHGTTMKGLAAAVPLVCLPMGRDQNDTAARVVHAGAGVRLSATASAKAIRAAVAKVLEDDAFRAGAARLARALSEREGCVDVVAELEAVAWRRTAAA